MTLFCLGRGDFMVGTAEISGLCTQAVSLAALPCRLPTLSRTWSIVFLAAACLRQNTYAGAASQKYTCKDRCALS